MSPNKSAQPPMLEISACIIKLNNGSYRVGLHDLKALEQWLAGTITRGGDSFQERLRNTWPNVRDLITASKLDTAWEDPLEEGLSLTQSVDRIFKSPEIVPILMDIIEGAIDMDMNSNVRWRKNKVWRVWKEGGYNDDHNDDDDSETDESRGARPSDYEVDTSYLCGRKLRDHWTAAARVNACAVILLSYLHVLCRQELANPAREESKAREVTTTLITKTPTGGTTKTTTTETVEARPLANTFTWSSYLAMIESIDLSFIKLPYKDGFQDGYGLRSSIQLLTELKEFIPMIVQISDFLPEDATRQLRVRAGENPNRCVSGSLRDIATELRTISHHLWRARIPHYKGTNNTSRQ